jgi:hypothetical protein
VGLDGEPLSLDPPLHFSIRRTPLRVRLPLRAVVSSRAAGVLPLRAALRGLWRTARGKSLAGSEVAT